MSCRFTEPEDFSSRNFQTNPSKRFFVVDKKQIKQRASEISSLKCSPTELEIYSRKMRKARKFYWLEKFACQRRFQPYAIHRHLPCHGELSFRIGIFHANYSTDFGFECCSVDFRSEPKSENIFVIQLEPRRSKTNIFRGLGLRVVTLHRVSTKLAGFTSPQKSSKII